MNWESTSPGVTPRCHSRPMGDPNPTNKSRLVPRMCTMRSDGPRHRTLVVPCQVQPRPVPKVCKAQGLCIANGALWVGLTWSCEALTGRLFTSLVLVGPLWSLKLKQTPTDLDLECLQQAVVSGNLALDVSACSSCTTTIDDDLAVNGADAEVESMDTDPEACELDYKLKLPFKLHKRWVMEQKKADGTWLPDSEWRRQKGKKSANERKNLRKQRELTPGEIVGANSIPSGKRGRLGGSSAEKPLPKRRPTVLQEQIEQTGNQNNPSAKEGVGEKFRKVLTGHKLAFVLKALKLQGRILNEVLSAEGVCLQFKRCFPERGALVMLCGKDETRDWLRELIRSIKVFLRVDSPMAGKNSATILGTIGRQNAGISVSDWKVVGDVHIVADCACTMAGPHRGSRTICQTLPQCGLATHSRQSICSCVFSDVLESSPVSSVQARSGLSSGRARSMDENDTDGSIDPMQRIVDNTSESSSDEDTGEDEADKLYVQRGAFIHNITFPITRAELLPFVFNGVIVTGGEKKWGWRGPSCQLEIARQLTDRQHKACAWYEESMHKQVRLEKYNKSPFAHSPCFEPRL
ncbi:hypothetical protein J6590_070025 [Homalodisca vitripennis]|nr:hypothetical protein J6590_070025 [Homalodisca vitripennis]